MKIPILLLTLFSICTAQATTPQVQNTQNSTQPQPTQTLQTAQYNQQQPQNQQQLQNQQQPVDQRQLTLSPYIHLNHDYSAKPPGHELDQTANVSNSGVPGFHNDMPVPTLGPMGMLPGYTGMLHHPMNYMYGSMMGAIHPMNPVSPLNPMNQMAMAGMAHHMATKAAPVMTPNAGGVKHFRVKVESRCDSVKRQALEIANKIMKRQNKIIYKELMTYLMKSKFLIGMTEVKLGRVLRKKIFGVMHQHSNLTSRNLHFVGGNTDKPELNAIDAEPFMKGSPHLDGIIKSI